MKNLLLLFSLLFVLSCTTEEINHACDEFENATSETSLTCGVEDIFISSTAPAYDPSPMGYSGETAPLWWFGYLAPGCNIKFLEHEISWNNNPYLSRCEPHEIGNIDTWICQKIDLGNGNSLYYRDQHQETFDGKSHANAVCNCTYAVELPSDFGEEGDPLYLKVTPPSE